MSEFFQDAPKLGNQYDDDALLRGYLRWRLPAKMLAEIEPELHRLGDRAATDIRAPGEAAEAEPPSHGPDEARGERAHPSPTRDPRAAPDPRAAEEGNPSTR